MFELTLGNSKVNSGLGCSKSPVKAIFNSTGILLFIGLSSNGDGLACVLYIANIFISASNGSPSQAIVPPGSTTNSF